MSESEQEKDFVSVAWLDSDDWKDVEPTKAHPSEEIEHDSLSHPISPCMINYSEDFKKVNSYFRTVLLTEEKSERTLKLTELMIEENAANYTAWEYRREILSKLVSTREDLLKEFSFVSESAEENPKNYQIWQHRRCLVGFLAKLDKQYFLSEGILNEINFLGDIFEGDAKNYHAWAHRQFVLNLYCSLTKNVKEISDSELLSVNDLLSKDLRNNSAWNYRFYVIFVLMLQNYEEFTEEIKLGLLLTEFHFVKEKVSIVWKNESPFTYLSGVIEKLDLGDFSLIEKIVSFFEEKIEKSIFVKMFLLDVYNLEYVKNMKGTKEKIKGICKQLQEEDKIREKYWEHYSLNYS
eukprot:snap_masked-scaffold_62-processed-gene-0.42-mRNA-1 protein AED:0.23 eAED:0.30 QI:0/-1/0/1/-1/1/1/0/349